MLPSGGADNTFKSVTVKKNGVFNITKLNSGGDKDKLETKPHDTLLLSRNQSFTFNDSALHVGGKVFTGKLKVGQLANADQTHKGTVAFNGGDHAFEYLTIGSDSQVTIADGTLDLGGSVRISVSGEVIPGAAQRGCPLFFVMQYARPDAIARVV